MVRKVQRTAYIGADLSRDVDNFLDESEEYDGFSDFVRETLEDQLEREEYSNE